MKTEEKKKVTIFFRNGGAEYLRCPEFNFGAVGRVNIKRVTTIEFDNEAQIWVAALMDGTEIGRDTNREKLLELEHRVITQMQRDGIPIPNAPAVVISPIEIKNENTL